MNSLKFVGMSVAVILLLCFISESAAQVEIEDVESLENEADVLETVQGLLEDVQLMMTEQADSSDPDENKRGCTCDRLKCTCCQRIRIRRLRIKKNCCVKVAFFKDTYKFEISVKIGSRTIFRRSFSARRPRPICVSASLVLRKGASVCLALYNVRIEGKRVFACVRIEFRVYRRTVARYKVGCFRVGSSDEAVESVDQLELPAAADGGDYVPVEEEEEEEDLESQSFDGPELMDDGLEDEPFSPDEGEVVFMERIELPINSLGDNKL